MRVGGIICEYNPFHRAHAQHIAWTKAQLGADSAVLCVMSGNFVQRGEPAVFEKHARAAAAVRGGADLVVELPLPWAVATAETFAAGGVALLEATGICTHLSFGSEAGDTTALQRTADCLQSAEMDEMIRQKLTGGVSYAAARQMAADVMLGDSAEILRHPNNILAIEYLKAVAACGSSMLPLTFARRGAAHDGTETDAGIASASYIRALLLTGGVPWTFVGDAAAEIFRGEIAAGRGPVSLAASETAVLARLRTLPAAAFAALPGDSEGLSDRLRRYAGTEPDIHSMLEKTKSKRYAMSRIRRMVLSAYLGLTAADSGGTPPYVRVLAFNRTGQRLLRELGRKCTLPVITKPAAVGALGGEAARIFELEAAATDLYVLGYPEKGERSGGQEWRISPVRLPG